MSYSKDTPSFKEFFELDSPETSSPFIKSSSRFWGSKLTIKASILAAIFLLISFAISWNAKFVPLSNLLLVMVYFLAGIPALIESIEDLAEFDINIDILMTLAAFSSVLIGSGMEGALLLVLFALSGAMEDEVTEKAKSSISSLHKLAPSFANVVQEDDSTLETALDNITVGTVILVKAGQVIPLDGIVTEGESSVNLVHLTGENFPVLKKVNDEVAAGSLNLDGFLKVNVSRTSSDSTLARIIRLVTDAQDAKPKLQRAFDRFSTIYAITIISLSACFALSFPFLFGLPFLGTEGSLYRALAFLIAASPCALIIAMPIAYLSAIGACAKRGILLKGGVILDSLSECKSVAFDKTGTLTTGDLTCSGIDCLSGSYDSNEVLALSYALENNAIHPVAKAIVKYAKDKQIHPSHIKDFKSIPGHGLEAKTMDDQAVSIGNPKFIASQLDPEKAELLLRKAAVIEEKGELVAALKIDNNLFIFSFQDTIRKEIKKTIDNLQNKLHLNLYMLTGDHELSAKRVAKELNIKKYHANLKPEDKLEYVTKLSSNGLAMVGDGINDAPALARASVGICMGKVGTTTAMEAADIVLLQDNIERLDWLFEKAFSTQKIVRQNLSIAVAAIFVATIPSLAGFIPLWLAVLLHEGGTVIVGLNGLRLLKKGY